MLSDVIITPAGILRLFPGQAKITVTVKTTSSVYMPSASTFEKVLREQLDASHVEVSDTSGGCGQAFEVIVVSEAFKGRSRLLRHKAVNNALKDQIASVHAFTQKTFTPEEWANKQQAT